MRRFPRRRFSIRPELSVGDALRAVRLEVINRQRGRMLTWREVKAPG